MNSDYFPAAPSGDSAFVIFIDEDGIAGLGPNVLVGYNRVHRDIHGQAPYRVVVCIQFRRIKEKRRTQCDCVTENKDVLSKVGSCIHVE